MQTRLNALFLGTFVLIQLTASHANDTVDRNFEVHGDVRQRRAQDAANITFVLQMAFSEDGKALGSSDSWDSGWTTSNLDLEVKDGEPEYKYHADAAYYIVGDNDSLVVEFWHPVEADEGGKDMAAVHLKVARQMVIDHRSADGKDQLSVKVVNKGWDGVVDDEMCAEDSVNGSCPALVLAGTTQVKRFAS